MAWKPPARPRWVERLISYGDCVGGASRLISLDADECMQSAAHGAGLEDFGEGHWITHYRIFMDSLENESKLHLPGRLMARVEVMRSLHNRLRLVDLWKRHSDILSEPIEAPVFVTGTPRSGTSILHELLSLDPGSRWPALWQMLHPVEALEGEALRQPADDYVQSWHDLLPEYETMHANHGDLPNECIFITMSEFLSDQWGGCHNVPSYDRHHLAWDQRDNYRFHRRFLQTLQQGRRGTRWLLKAPSHLSRLRELFDIYPDARVIVTHRDPLKALASGLSLLGALKWMRCEEVDLSPQIEQMPVGMTAGFRAQIDQRESGELPTDQIVDLRYHELMADPARTIGEVYERMGWSYPASLEKSIANYVSEKPKASRGEHKYSLEELGLDAAALRGSVRFYQEYFDIPDEL